MIREVDLVHYLPLYLRDFQEIPATLEAENPEFTLVWNAADQVLNNEFIATADEYGISRFESILGILPYKEDTLESRRARVAARWFDQIPYTIRRLIEKLKTICGDTDFELIYDFTEDYHITIITDLENYGQVEELEKVLNSWLPVNLVFDSVNEIPCDVDGDLIFRGGVCYADEFVITNDESKVYEISSESKTLGGVSSTVCVLISNDISETWEMEAEMKVISGTVIAEMIEIN